MSNSSLVSYKKISPNRTSPRNHKIDKITIHYMAGDLSVETCGNVFAPKSRQASSNYGIGSDGRIGMYVEEKDRSWCSSSGANDHRAVTIECANKSGGALTNACYNSLIKLCVDICKRNGIKKLNYTGNTSGNLTMHCWFADTSCPGPWLKARFAQIAKEVNAKLGASEKTVASKFTLSDANYPTKIQVGSPYSIRGKITSANPLKRVEVGVVDSTGKKWVEKYDNKSLSGKTFNIANADTSVHFGKLKAGTYFYRIWAHDANGAKKVLDQKFTVASASGSKFTLTGANHPTSIKKGQAFSLKGKITSNLTMTRIEIGVVKDGKWTSQKVDKKISAKTFDIHSVDNSIRFGSLARGTYYYRIWVHDKNGAKRILNEKFTVK